MYWKVPLDLGFRLREGMPRSGERSADRGRESESFEDVLRDRPRRKTCPVHEVQAAPGGARSHCFRATSTGQPERRAEEHAASHRASGSPRATEDGAAALHRVTGSPVATGSGAAGSTSRGGTPTAASVRRTGGVTKRRHGQPCRGGRCQRSLSRVRPERWPGAFPVRRGGTERQRAGFARSSSQNGHRPPSLRARRAM